MGMRPVPGMYPVTQTYRQNATQYNLGAYHGALDYGVPVGTPVVAPEDGVVRHAGFAWDLPGGPHDWAVRDYQIKPARGDLRTGGGIMVRLDNTIGSRWWSAHLNRTDLNPGDRVRKGQIIGYSGNTGSSTGPHLHLSLLPRNPQWGNGAWGAVDPAPYLTEPYRPLTAVSWQGAPTQGVGSAVTDEVTDFVDVSEHNTVATVRKVATDAIILRTGWGVGGDDKLFAQHLSTARSRKLRIGTYHYAYLSVNDPRAEARYYASRVPSDAEFAVLDYEDLLSGPNPVPVDPSAVAAFAEEFRRHSSTPLYLYTWGWVAERIDPRPFGGRLWLPDFGTNPVFTGYARSVIVPKVKGWTVIANQYGDRFTPATGGQFDINKHLGGMWERRPTVSTTPKEWDEMATRDEIQGVIREENAALAEPIRAMHSMLAALGPFTDVLPGAAFHREIAWVKDAGLLRGFAGGKFKPGSAATREQVAAALYRLAGEPQAPTTGGQPFADVPAGHVFAQHIGWMHAAGISTGWSRPDGTRVFKPAQPVSRGQLAAFLYRLGGHPDYQAPDVSPFTDVTPDTPFYRQITWMAATGISTGWDDGTFHPGRAVTREQLAAFLYRYHHKES